MNKEEFKDEMKETVLVAVKESFAAKISEAEQREDPETPEGEEEKAKENEEGDEEVKENEEGDEDKEDEDDIKENEEGDDLEDDDEDDDVVEEALKVKATKNGKERNLEISNFKALVQLAKSGGYESFVVNDGKEEIEYAVSNGRLVEL